MNLPRPKRQKRPKMGVRVSEMIRSDGHLKWIKGCRCSVEDGLCEGRIEPAHVRLGTDGGTGMRPSDCWVVPLCAGHHAEQHSRKGPAAGEYTFWNKRGIDPKELAMSYWNLSPHGRKWRMEHKG